MVKVVIFGHTESREGTDISKVFVFSNDLYDDFITIMDTLTEMIQKQYKALDDEFMTDTGFRRSEKFYNARSRIREEERKVELELIKTAEMMGKEVDYTVIG
jgi:hypothetical protein